MSDSSKFCLSIVTPVRNGASFIRDCIACVAEEAKQVPLEHLVIDGASTDGTVEMLAEFARKHTHLRVVSEPDSGQSEAMNKGITLARGAMLGFLNVDDFYEPGALARAAAELTKLPEPALVIGNCRMWDADGKLLGTNRPTRYELLDLLIPENSDFLPINPSQYLYHRSLHEEIGPYPTDEHFVMDIDFYLRVAAVSRPVYVDEVWGNFRLIPGTKTYDDIDCGTASARLTKVLAKHRRYLSFHQRLVLWARRWRLLHMR